MSALFGLLSFDGCSPERRKLEAMSAILAHRGSDDVHIFVRESVGLGHRMLWTTPESLNEQLPAWSADGRLIITADARIDNRDELIDTLDLRANSFDALANPVFSQSSTITDSAIILAAYERWGERCVDHLLGDFAFVIWDNARQTLFCARDPMGVKPFFYCCNMRSFAFASEIKGVLAAHESTPHINELKIADLLAGITADSEATIYADIKRLPAAHTLTVTDGHLTKQRYWLPDPERELRLDSDEAYAEAFRSLFAEAVHCRTRSAFPIGSLLSGGLDSSSIACTARSFLLQHKKPALATFSAIFPDLPSVELKHIDERCFIDQVLATGGFSPAMICADQISPIGALDSMLWHQDEPFFAPNMYIHWAIYRAAQAQGVRIMLDGIDGDSTVSHGWEYLPDLARSGRWLRLALEAYAAGQRYGVHTHQLVWSMALKPLIDEVTTRLRPSSHNWLVGPTINRDFARRMQLEQRVYELEGAAPPAHARKQHWRGITSPFMTRLMDLTDKAASAFGIDARYPFFDRRLIEFCLAVPADQKIRKGIDRWLMRRAMAGILPEQVQRRQIKADLGLSFRRRLLEYERESIEAVIINDPERISPFFDIRELQTAYNRYTNNAIAHEQDIFAVYTAVVLDRWIKHL